MRRALAVALLALALAGCAGASAQSDAPSGWPTVEGLRAELDGWTWVAFGLTWSGGPAGVGRGVSLSTEEGRMHVRTSLSDTGFRGSGEHLWPAGPEWTAFREIAVRLPIPDAIQMRIAAVASAEADDCLDLALAGGTVTVERFRSAASVWIDEGGEARCPGLAEIRARQDATLGPGAVPSPAA